MIIDNHMTLGEPKDNTICNCGGEFWPIVYCPEYGCECYSDGCKCDKLDDEISDCEHGEERLKCNGCNSIVEGR